MDPFKTAGAFSWNELMTTDPQAAKAFYTQLFGWATREQPMDSGVYTVVSVGESAVAGIMKITPEMGPMPPAWGSYVTVSDADASAKKAVELGGKLLAGPFDVPQVGRMAVLQDPQGAVISVMAYSF
ncbi:MAG: VOC family protein [Burkholderiaceae bacterium]